MNPFAPRSNEDPWFRIGTLAVTTTVFICGVALVSMFVLAAAPGSLDSLVLFPALVRRGEVWRLVTYLIPNDASLSSVISIVLVFIFGRELETPLGRVRYLWFVGIISVVPAAIVSATGLFPFGGAAGLSYLELGLFAAFVASFPTARSFFNIPLWVLGAVFIGIQILQLVGDRAWDPLIFLLLELAVALLMARAFGLSELTQIPRVPLPAFITKDPYQKAHRQRELAASAATQARAGHGHADPTEWARHRRTVASGRDRHVARQDQRHRPGQPHPR